VEMRFSCRHLLLISRESRSPFRSVSSHWAVLTIKKTGEAPYNRKQIGVHLTSVHAWDVRSQSPFPLESRTNRKLPDHKPARGEGIPIGVHHCLITTNRGIHCAIAEAL